MDRIGLALTCWAVAAGVGQWLIGPTTMPYTLRFALVLIALSLWSAGTVLLIRARWPHRLRRRRTGWMPLAEAVQLFDQAAHADLVPWPPGIRPELPQPARWARWAFDLTTDIPLWTKPRWFRPYTPVPPTDVAGWLFTDTLTTLQHPTTPTRAYTQVAVRAVDVQAEYDMRAGYHATRKEL